jgi:hypothetical protein
MLADFSDSISVAYIQLPEIKEARISVYELRQAAGGNTIPQYLDLYPKSY